MRINTPLYTLTKGKTYDLDTIRGRFAGWIEDRTGSADRSEHIEGYSIADYFDFEGRYLGPDECGIEPMFSTKNWPI